MNKEPPISPLPRTVASNPDRSEFVAQTEGRPQRYGNILVNDRSRLRPNRFNLFGGASDGALGGLSVSQKGATCSATATYRSNGMQNLGVKCLFEAVRSLEWVLRCEIYHEIHESLSSSPVSPSHSRSGPHLFLASVGSYALGCWNSPSDIDCLCIGEISSRTFFNLTIQRLRKPAAQGG